MNWQDVKDAIAKYAPGVEGVLELASLIPGAGAITGPAAIAIKTLGKAFGTEATPDALVQAITTDPNAALKLKQSQLDFEVEMGKQRIAELEIYVKDVQNARAREVEIFKVTGRRDKLQFWLALAGVLCPVSLVTWLVIQGLPKGLSNEGAALIGGFIGIIIGEYKTIYGYFFGSSKGSELKTEMLSKAEPIK